MKCSKYPSLKSISNYLSKQFSYHLCKNSFWKIPICSNEGIYGITPPDLLHQFKLGILKYVVKWTTEMIQEINGNSKEQLSLMDSRIMNFNTRTAWNGIDICSFKNGIVNVSHFEGKHYLSMVYQIMISIGINHKIITNPSISIKYHNCINHILKLWSFLNNKSINENQIQILEDQIKITMKSIEEVFGNYSKSKMKFVKFHKLLHYSHFIRQFGCPSLYDAAPFETFHTIAAKNPFKRSNKQFDSSKTQMMERVNLQQSINIKNDEESRLKINNIEKNDLFGKIFNCEFENESWNLNEDLINNNFEIRNFNESWENYSIEQNIYEESIEKGLLIYKSLKLNNDTILRTYKSFGSNKKEWYDYCSIKYSIGSNETILTGFAKLLLFIKYNENINLVFVKWLEPVNNQQKQNRILPKLYYKFAKRNEEFWYDIVDIKNIVGAVWVQQDFDNNENYWILN